MHADLLNPEKRTALWKRKPRKMTIALGVICGGIRSPAIVLASDSQSTVNGATKHLDERKISIINFLDAQLLIAYAGEVDMAATAIELMRGKAAKVKLESKKSVDDIAEAVIKEIRERCLGGELELLMGFYCDGEPCLRIVNYREGMSCAIEGTYRVIGCGDYLADFLLREYRQADPNFESGILIAAAVVEKTSANVDGCGGPTQVGIVYPVPEEIIKAQERIQEVNRSNRNRDLRPYYKSESHLIDHRYLKLMVDELHTDERQEARSKRQRTFQTLARINQLHREEINAQIQAENEAEIRAENE